METKKLLTTVVVFAVVLAATSTIIEAQRDSHGGGSGGGGHHWSVNAGSDNNNAGNNAGAIDVYVSTDKQRYVLGEPIEITMTAYNPTGSTVEVFVLDSCSIPISYIIDGYITRYVDVDENGNLIGGAACMGTGGPLVLQPHETITITETRKGGTAPESAVVPLPVGRHSVVGIIKTGDYNPITIWATYVSRPITIWVTEPNNGGM